MGLRGSGFVAENSISTRFAPTELVLLDLLSERLQGRAWACMSPQNLTRVINVIIEYESVMLTQSEDLGIQPGQCRRQPTTETGGNRRSPVKMAFWWIPSPKKLLWSGSDPLSGPR